MDGMRDTKQLMVSEEEEEEEEEGGGGGGGGRGEKRAAVARTLPRILAVTDVPIARLCTEAVDAAIQKAGNREIPLLVQQWNVPTRSAWSSLEDSVVLPH